MEPKDSTALNLSLLSNELERRQVPLQETLNILAKHKEKRIFYPFGRTGAGKTTFTLFVNGIKLQLDQGRYRVVDPNHALSDQLTIGAGAKSETIFIGVTVCDDCIFLDGPGFGDTEGNEVDIANVLCLKQLFGALDSFIPILFLEYHWFDTDRGRPLRESLQMFSGMFDDNLDMLEKHLFVVWNKVPKDVSEKVLIDRIKDVNEANTKQNTPEVKDFLERIIQAMEETFVKPVRKKKPLVNHIQIFRPLDEPDDLVDILENMKPMPNPGDEFTAYLPIEAKTALAHCLQKLKAQVPELVQKGDFNTVTQHLVMLSKLGDVVDSIQATLNHCCGQLHSNLLNQLADCKQRMTTILHEGAPVSESEMKKFAVCRDTLLKIEPLRSFLGPIETPQVFDEWSRAEIKKMIEATRLQEDYVQVAFSLRKLGQLEPHMQHLVEFNTLHSELRLHFQKKVQELASSIGQRPLSSEGAEQLRIDIILLNSAAEEICPHLQVSSSEIRQLALNSINEKLDAMKEACLLLIRNSPSSADPKSIVMFETLRVLSTNKLLMDLLGQTEVNRYADVLQKGLEVTSINLKQLESSEDLGEEMEQLISRTQALCDLDRGIKDAFGLDLTRCVLKLDYRVEKMLEDSKNAIFYRKEGPDFRQVPSLMIRFKKYLWLDKYSSNKGRIEARLKELSTTVLGLYKRSAKKLETFYARGEYRTVVEQYALLFEEELEHLQQASIEGLDDIHLELTESLQKKIKTLFSEVQGQMALASSQHLTHVAASLYLEEFEKLTLLCTRLNLHSDLMKNKLAIERFLRDESAASLESIRADQTYDFAMYRRVLSDFASFDHCKNLKLLPNICQLEAATIDVQGKITKLVGVIDDAVLRNDLAEARDKLKLLENAFVLMSYFPNVATQINESKRKLNLTINGLLPQIRSSFDEGKFSELPGLLTALQENPETKNDYQQARTYLRGNLNLKCTKMKNNIISFSLKEAPSAITGIIHDLDELRAAATNVNEHDPTFFEIQPRSSELLACLDGRLSNFLALPDDATDLNVSATVYAIVLQFRGVEPSSLQITWGKLQEQIVIARQDESQILELIKGEKFLANFQQIEIYYHTHNTGTQGKVLENAIRNRIIDGFDQVFRTQPPERDQLWAEWSLLSSRVRDTVLQQLVLEQEARARTKIEEQVRNKSREFDSLLNTLNLAPILNHLRDEKDPNLLLDAKSRLSAQLQHLFLPLNPQTSNATTIVGYCGHLRTLQNFIQAIPGLNLGPFLNSKIQELNQTGSYHVREIQTIFQTGVVPQKIGLLIQHFELLLIVKDAEAITSTPLLSEQEFASLLAPLCTELQENRNNLDIVMSRFEFHKISGLLFSTQTFTPLIQQLKKAFSAHKSEALATITVVLDNCLDEIQARKKVDQWFNDFPNVVEAAWKKTEFGTVARILQAISSGTAASLASLFPNLQRVLSDVEHDVRNRYDQVSTLTLNHLQSERWKQFRDSLTILEKMVDIEVCLKKNAFQECKAQVLSKVDSIVQHSGTKVEEVAESLVQLNVLKLNVPQFERETNQASLNLIKAVGSDDKIYALGCYLDGNEVADTANAKDVARSFKAFSQVTAKLFLDKTTGQTIDWALSCPANSQVHRFRFSDSFQDDSKGFMWALQKTLEFCSGPVAEKMRKKWKQDYDKFKQEFRPTCARSMSKMPEIIRETKELCKEDQDKKSNRNLVTILRNISVVWSRKRAGDSATTFLEPHPIQFLALLRLLERNERGGYFNQLIEILTGEGKSVVLGVLATYFGLMNYDVHSICYSSYLSKRDYDDFAEVFEAFGVQQSIHYSTIAGMCELMINKEGSVRDLAKSVIESAATKHTPVLATRKSSVLLIDEVDTFFGPSFYGETYNPATLISNEFTYDILNFIYANKSKVNILAVTKSDAYNKLCGLYPTLKPLINYEIKRMLVDVASFTDTPKPIVLNGEIYYKDQDGISRAVYGYKTAFQYFDKWQSAEIDQESVKKHVGVYIGCGNFSFAEIPRDFVVKIGVSGTLSSLTEQEKEIIQSYGIQRLAYAPSIYGDSLLNKTGKGQQGDSSSASELQIVQEQSQWFLRIVNQCKSRTDSGRAVLVFFENETILEAFIAAHNSSLGEFSILDEKQEHKDSVVKQSTRSKALTLCTRPFGRGVDFICLDKSTKEKGGVHVIQTFVAESEAEQIQIRGRAARQGDPGSHEYLLFYGDLIKNLGTVEGKPKHSGFDDFDHDQELSKKDLLQKIVGLRDVLYTNAVIELQQKRKDALPSHNMTQDFYKLLRSYDATPASATAISKKIMELNSGLVQQSVMKYHLFFCLDESGSMAGSPWNELMNAVRAFISKRIDMCKENGSIPEDLVTITAYASSARTPVVGQLITSNPDKSLHFKSGGTCFQAGLNEVRTQIQKANLDGFKPCLLFMSDGGDSTGRPEMQALHQTYPDLVVFVIGFSSGCDRAGMQKLAELGGGQFMFGASGAELKSSFEQISVKISGGVLRL